MTTFKPAYSASQRLDPHKRVNYAPGLVLGVDEFVQEELHLLEKHRRHNRALHGFGTVSGLRLSKQGDDSQPEIVVEPGLAVDAKGREICVPVAQCARLNDWLLRNRDEVVGQFGSPPSASPAMMNLSVMLCFDECATDEVPVPTGPCQSLDRTMAPSRIADDFRLRFRAEPTLPERTEDEAERKFIALLNEIPVRDAPGGLGVKKIAKLVRLLASPSLPVIQGHMRPADVYFLLQAAWRVWVTEVRPGLAAGEDACAGSPPGDACVLIGRVRFPVEDRGQGPLVSGPVKIDQSDRPILLHTRFFQEYMHFTHAAARSGSPDAPSGGGTTTETTFAAPVILTGAGRVRRRIDVLSTATSTINSAVRVVTSRSAPAIQFPAAGGSTAGEVNFSLSPPDDFDAAAPLRIRLYWHFDAQGAGSPPTREFKFHWQIRNQFRLPGKVLQAGPAAPPIDIEGAVPAAQEFTVLATQFVNLPEQPTDHDQLGLLQIRLQKFDPAEAQVFLTKVEIDYVANQLGRAVS